MKLPIKQITVKKASGKERQRTNIGESDFQTLIFSMDVRGLINPITVTKTEEGKYELLAGERRLNAAKTLGWNEIEATLLEDLSEVEREEVELEENIRRTNLSWQDQARAMERLMFLRKQEQRMRNLDSFTGGFTQGDLAKEYGVSSAKFSQDIKLAKGLREFPELANIRRRVDALKTIRKLKARENRMPETLLLEKVKGVFIYEENSLKYLNGLTKNDIDLIIIDTEVSHNWKALITVSKDKLVAYGFGLIFCNFENYQDVITTLLAEECTYPEQPLVWQSKRGIRTCTWYSKHVENQPDPIKQMVIHEQQQNPPHLTTKSYGLFNEYVRALSQVNGLVFAPDCYSVELVKLCFNIKRKVIALCPDREILERIYANLTTKEIEE